MSVGKRVSPPISERRQFPRVAITIPVMLSRSVTPWVTGLMHNVSPGGMHVRLSPGAAAKLMPKGEKIKLGGEGCFRAQFLVPLRGERFAISVNCVAAHVSLVDGAMMAARVAIGFRFKRFKDAKTLRRFVLFIEEQLVPMEDYELYLHGSALPRAEAG
jgi:hypothetical protein